MGWPEVVGQHPEYALLGLIFVLIVVLAGCVRPSSPEGDPGASAVPAHQGARPSPEALVKLRHVGLGWALLIAVAAAGCEHLKRLEPIILPPTPPPVTQPPAPPPTPEPSPVVVPPAPPSPAPPPVPSPTAPPQPSPSAPPSPSPSPSGGSCTANGLGIVKVGIGSLGCNDGGKCHWHATVRFGTGAGQNGKPCDGAHPPCGQEQPGSQCEPCGGAICDPTTGAAWTASGGLQIFGTEENGYRVTTKGRGKLTACPAPNPVTASGVLLRVHGSACTSVEVP